MRKILTKAARCMQRRGIRIVLFQGQIREYENTTLEHSAATVSAMIINVSKYIFFIIYTKLFLIYNNVSNFDGKYMYILYVINY